jgi:hypothetical protein
MTEGITLMAPINRAVQKTSDKPSQRRHDGDEEGVGDFGTKHIPTSLPSWAAKGVAVSSRTRALMRATMVGIAAPRMIWSSAASRTARSAALSINTPVIPTPGDDVGKGSSLVPVAVAAPVFSCCVPEIPWKTN